MSTKLRSLKSSERDDGDVVIRCEHVTKRFYYYEHRTVSLQELFIRAARRQPVHIRRPEFTLQPFSLTVRRGESVVLLGPNGSGKSTVLRLLAGIYQPTTGALDVRGQLAAVIELGAGFHPELTGAENVALYGAVMGLGRAEIAAQYPAIVAFAGIEEFMDMPVKYYSSGMQARLAFAVTICVEPDILLIDEVLAVGDQTFRAQCLERLAAFRSRGGTLVIVSHDLDAVARLSCARAVWFDRGSIRMDGAFDAVRQAYEATR